MSETNVLELSGNGIADRAIASMRSPKDMHIICIDVTNRCDLRCSNCTRLLVNQDHHWDMTPDNFRTALRSLTGFQGVIAMIGGNPCLHRSFPDLCRIFAEEIPVKRQRGLWSNNVFEFQELIRDTFGFFNLNPHNDQRCIDSLSKLRDVIPGLSFYQGNSRHAPLLTAVRDIVPDEAGMWEAIARCDINQNWSATIVENNGALRAYFCEVAASFDLARRGDHGTEVTVGWWRRSIADFSDQVKRFCPGCGVPARLAARLDSDETDDYSATNADIACATRGKRKALPILSPEDARRTARPVTDYSEQHNPQVTVPEMGVIVSVVIPCYNGADTIEETIESVLAQRQPGAIRVDIVVADDASTDDSAAKVAALAEQHPNSIRFLPATTNAGPATARNRGLKHVRGDLVCFLDADDCYNPGFFERAVALFQANLTLGAVVTGVEFVDSHRDIHPLHHAAVVNSIPSNVMVRRGVAEILGGFPEDAAFRGKGAGEDVVFRNLLSANFLTFQLEQPFLRYRVRRGSHFDLFLDSTEIADGALRPTRQEPEDLDGSRPAAGAMHRQAFARKIQTLDQCQPHRAFEPRGLEIVRAYEAVRDKIGPSLGIAPSDGYFLYRCAVHTPGRGYIATTRRAPLAMGSWLDEGSRAAGRLPTVPLRDIHSSAPETRIRLLAIEVPPNDDAWKGEFQSALPRLGEAAYVAFHGVGATIEPAAIAALLRATGEAWTEVGLSGAIAVFEKGRRA